MENTKKSNGLVIFLIIVVLLLATCLGLLLSGVVKNPFVKETKVEEKNTIKEEEKKDSTTVKETRYYQFKTESEKGSEEDPMYKYYEIELNTDGTARVGFLRVLDTMDKKGIYVENDKYIILTLNTESSECVEGNYQPKIADVCSDTIILIKDNGVLKEQKGSIYHFEIDNVNNSREYLKVNKSELQTSLKD